MKIEKLTENKIRVIVNPIDLNLKNINMKSLSIALEKQSFFAEVLDKAKTELDFDTDGYKLLIETFSLNDDFIIFTITKYSSYEIKKPVAKRKILDTYKNNKIYKFDTFDDFCLFCSYINTKTNLDYKAYSKNISLYLYKGTYILLIKNINNSIENKKNYCTFISEFAKSINYSNTFENKLIEYGRLIIKKNAIEKGIKYLS